ncbi:hypothetical protein GCM10011375_09830 [Hymenobacter qilianensis]|uniref:Uncharacterized protein n=2 Tax=Hymenobacter qilianensis TaxID=1385715 RepID=A0ACB5PNN8_9BACT|nr:hypothetical protein [Hymenobacter qilianensis]QNP53412.1 hypothetical protein H9L05_07440 [Hymenobacter qilianensis]GGF56715.1 hypothetical protein GCM10011375_09830 [Hymenobacter qilianensis]
MKKNLFLPLFLSLVFSTAQAQISKGTTLVGGSVGYSQSNSENKYVGSATSAGQSTTEFTSRNLNLNPNVGYFLAENLAVGLSFGFGSGKETGPYYSPAPDEAVKRTTKTTSFSGAPFLRYYYLPAENFGFYGQLSAGLSRQTTTTKFDFPGYSSPRNQTNGAFVSITPAFVFFPINKLGLELTAGSLGYTRTHIKPKDLQTGQNDTEAKISGFAANFGLSNLTLGASYYIGRQ